LRGGSEEGGGVEMSYLQTALTLEPEEVSRARAEDIIEDMSVSDDVEQSRKGESFESVIVTVRVTMF
jgi:hypothetical protein